MLTRSTQAAPADIFARDVNEVDVARDLGSEYSAPGNLVARDDDLEVDSETQDEILSSVTPEEIQLEDPDSADNSTSVETSLEARDGPVRTMPPATP
jgi:hypothetical protein